MRTLFFAVMFLVSGHFLSAQNFKFGKGSKEEVMEKTHPDYPEADAAILFRSHKTYYEVNPSSGLTLVTEIQERIKIYNKEGFDWAQKEVDFFRNGTDKEKVTGIKGVTYNLENGKLKEDKLRKNGIFEEEKNDYQSTMKFSMPAVREGSVVEYQYQLRSPFLVNIDEVPLQFLIPLNSIEVKVRIPEFLVFKKHFNTRSPLRFDLKESRQNFTYNYTQNRRNGQRVITHQVENQKLEYLQHINELDQENIPPLEKDVYVDHLQNYAAFLRWELQYTHFPNAPIENYSSTWEGVTKTIYRDGLEKELGKENYYKKDLDQVLDGLSSQEEKIQAVYDFLRARVKWNGLVGFFPDKGVSKAYKEGAGNTADVNLMLTAMLNYSGIKANPVLVSTQRNGIPLFPTRNGFNYVISGVELPDDVLLLDATDPYAAPGELPKRARNWQGRIIREHGSSAWVNLMPAVHSKSNEMLNFQFEEDLSLSGKCMMKLTGLFAKSFREDYGGLERNNYIRILEEDTRNIVISNLEVQNEKSSGEDLNQTFEFQLKDAVEHINGKIYFTPMVFQALEENPFKADERHYPIFLNFPSIESKAVNIMLPEGFTVESMPESSIIEFNGGEGEFRFITSLAGNFLRVESQLTFSRTVFSSEDYEALKDFYQFMVDKHSEAIVLKKT